MDAYRRELVTSLTALDAPAPSTNPNPSSSGTTSSSTSSVSSGSSSSISSAPPAPSPLRSPFLHDLARVGESVLWEGPCALDGVRGTLYLTARCVAFYRCVGAACDFFCVCLAMSVVFYSQFFSFSAN